MEKKYTIGRGDEESVFHLFGPTDFLNEDKKLVPFFLEMKIMLFDNKEEADQFIENELPSPRIRNLLNQKKEYYQSVEVLCVENVYYYDKRGIYKPKELHMIYEFNEKILTETSSKVYTFGKVASFQKKQPEGYLGNYYVL